MSKPEATSAKSLEEIIASIRKSLSTDGGRGAGSKPARVEPELAPPDMVPGLSGLTDKLAGALNGAPDGAPLDDDLSDILAQDAKGPAPAKAPEARPPGTGGERRDPPWFRSASPEAAPSPSLEPVKLSRPEVLRASLPPLFSEDAEPILPMRPSAEAPKAPDNGLLWARTQPLPPSPTVADDMGKSAGSGISTARTQPLIFPAQAEPDDATGEAEGPSGARVELPVSQLFPEPPMPDASATPAAVEFVSSEAVATMPLPAEPAFLPPLDLPPPPAVEVAPAFAPPADSNTAGDHGAEAAAPDEPYYGVTAAEPGPAAASPGRTLEQVIGEHLEPVIRLWLASNLPRLVEKVVREEVVRTMAAERAAAKPGD
jgi:cell pole-organizing protein PopZ